MCVCGGGWGGSFDNVTSLYIRNILLYKRSKTEYLIFRRPYANLLLFFH